MNKFLLMALLSAVNLSASARDDWVCQKPDETIYIASKDTPDHHCRKVGRVEISRELANIVRRKPGGGAPDFPLFCAAEGGTDCQLAGGESESGSLGELKFLIYPDSAVIQADPGVALSAYKDESRWEIACERDAMSRAKSCTIDKGNLRMVVQPGKADYVAVGASHFPGSVTSVRVGSRRFDTSHRDGRFAAGQIIPALKDGQPIVTRYMKWPYRQWIDEEYTVQGAQSALKIARWLLKNGSFD